jgi:acylglycerol lipase
MEIQMIGTYKTAVYNYGKVENPLAVILLIHGLGEHSGRYDGWAARFNASGIAFRAFDLPGHGLSGGKRGTMPKFTELFSLIDSMLENVGNDFPGVPVILYGHSLGGGILLDYLIKNKPRIKGAIITSPWIKLTETPQKFKVWLASVSGKLLPDMTQASGLKTKYLSHDPQVVSDYENDPLVHGLISAGLFNSMTEAAENILHNSEVIDVPLLLSHGRDDMITSPAGTIEVAGVAPKATLKLWDGAYHEVHNDILRDEHFDFIREWIDTIL